MSARTVIYFAGSDEDYVTVQGAAGEIAARLNEDRRVVSFRSKTGREIFVAPAHVAMLEEATPAPGEAPSEAVER